MSDLIRPPEGWDYVGCRTCGFVTTVPLERIEPAPWCVHNGSITTWKEPVIAVDWTRMMRVRVNELGLLRTVTPETIERAVDAVLEALERVEIVAEAGDMEDLDRARHDLAALRAALPTLGERHAL